MTELGTRLKEARLSKGYSLDDLQDITKIQKRYLVAIEEGNYSIMPGSFYVRAFIKQYAEAVGLDAEEILAEFKKDLPNQPTEEVAQSISQSPTRRKLNARSTNRLLETMPKIIVALFIVVIILAIWFLNQQKVSNTPDELEDDVSELEYDKSPTPAKPVEQTDTEEDTEGTKEEPVEEEEEEPVVTQTITPGEVSGETTNYTLTGTDTMKIRIEVSGDTWVGIRNANGEEQVDARVYKAGEVVEHDSTANGYARIRLGNSKVTKVFVNDEEVKFVQDITTQNLIITLQQEQ